MKFTNRFLLFFSILSSISLALLLFFLNQQARSQTQKIKELQINKDRLERQNIDAQDTLKKIEEEIQTQEKLSKSQLDRMKQKLANASEALDRQVAVGPRPVCGDPQPKTIMPSGSTVNITWFPVFVPSARLNEIKAHFCSDAYLNRSINKVQVASFWNKERAQAYANWIRGTVGKPKSEVYSFR